MQTTEQRRKVAIPLTGYCDGCNRSVGATLFVWVHPDGSWVAPTLTLSHDDMITSVYGQDEFGQWHEVVFHWEAYTDAEREQQFMDLYWDLDTFREMGIHTSEEMLQSLRNYTEEVMQDLRKQTCGEFIFFDGHGERLRISYIVAMRDAEDSTQALAELMQEAP